MSEVSARSQPAEKLVIRPLGPEDLAPALALSRQVGWPHGKADWQLALAVSEGVVATLGNRVTGTACCSRFGPVALINMIIVDEAMRGRGLGRRLMEAVMARVAGLEMRLVATPEGLPLYAKLGFVATHEVLQHQGIARASAPELSEPSPHPVRDGTLADIGRLAEMDRAASGMERQHLLERIAAQGQVLLAGDGFALLREFGRGHVIGPVVARDAATARALIADGARRTAGRFLRVDLPEAAGLSDFAAALGLDHVGGGTAMVRTPATATASATAGAFTTYALVSQALG